MEEEKNKVIKIAWLVLTIIVLMVSFFAGCRFERWRIGPIESSADTVYQKVTVYKDYPDPVKTVSAGMIAVPRYLFFTESAAETETKYVYISQDLQKLLPLNNQLLFLPRETNVMQFNMPYVYLPRQQEYYEEQNGRLRIWVSGYEPRLDRYEWDDVTATITETRQLKNTHWGAGASGGYGVTIFDGKAIAGPSASVFGFYNFNRFGLGISGELNTAAYNGGLLATPSVKVFGFYSW